MNNTPVEKSLFDDLPVTHNRKKLKEAVEQVEVQEADETQPDWSDDYELLESIAGPEMALKIAKEFSGSTIYIPKNIITFRIYKKIKQRYKAGASYRELSLEYGYTETHIRNIIHRKKQE